MMKYYPIKKFGTKLMVSSKAINTIPQEYLRYSENARIYDWWIWPRKWMQLLTNSTLWTNNKGGFVMSDKLYQIANSKIYEINETTWIQTEKATLWYDARTDVLVYNNFAIIVSNWQPWKVFDWTTVTEPATITANNWIIEYCRWFSFLANWNVLQISRPILPTNPALAYDFTWSWSQTITYDSDIKWLKSTMNWLYVFTEEKIEYLWANALQNVAGASAFISTPLWDWWELMSNDLVATSWDKVFYVTKNLNINTINYVQWTAEPWLWELSNKPVVWIRELLQTIDIEQPNGFAFVNDNDNTVQFHLRTTNSPFNNWVITYDLINDTWNIDTGKNYNYIVKKASKYYGFSDVNTSIYEDDVWYSDNWIAIRFLIKTQSINLWAMQQKIFGWFFTSWAIWQLSSLTYRVNVDREWVFEDSINWETSDISWIWEIAWDTIWNDSIAWNLDLANTLNPFDFEADVGRIYQGGIRADIEIESQSQIQDFIIDWLWLIAEITPFTDLKNKF